MAESVPAPVNVRATGPAPVSGIETQVVGREPQSVTHFDSIGIAVPVPRELADRVAVDPGRGTTLARGVQDPMPASAVPASGELLVRNLTESVATDADQFDFSGGQQVASEFPALSETSRQPMGQSLRRPAAIPAVGDLQKSAATSAMPADAFGEKKVMLGDVDAKVASGPDPASLRRHAAPASAATPVPAPAADPFTPLATIVPQPVSRGGGTVVNNESESRRLGTVVDSFGRSAMTVAELERQIGRPLEELEQKQLQQVELQMLPAQASEALLGKQLAKHGVRFKVADAGVEAQSRLDIAAATKNGTIREEQEAADREGWFYSPYRIRDHRAPGGESYSVIVENQFIRPDSPATARSTFGLDVDTGSYANVRRFLNQNQLPPSNAVRLEELINYFRYDDPEPNDGKPLSVSLESAPCPWNVEHSLVRIGVKAKDLPRETRPPTNIVFLVDVSGSMRDNNKLPLVKSSLEMLATEMTENDRIAIITYAGKAGMVLDSTPGTDRHKIIDVIRGLSAGGSTNGEAGIRLAYETAVKYFYKDGANRVILCTDGDFNVGVSDDNELVKMIQDKAGSGVFLSIFGFGMGNLKDAKLEQLADHGNGHYGYIDGMREARKVFIEELTGTLYTVAKDAKLRVEFNPAKVGEYRLLGYENRLLTAAEFNDDAKDAGDIGAGHSVTALYEIVSRNVVDRRDQADPLKYQSPPETSTGDPPANRPAGSAVDRPTDTVQPVGGPELLTVSLRYKQPDANTSTLHEFPLVVSDGDPVGSTNLNWAAAVASFGMVLRDSKFKGNATFDSIAELARQSIAGDVSGRRSEFVELVGKAREIHRRLTGETKPDDTPPLTDEKALKKAAVDGRYHRLLRVFEAPDDTAQYGTFHDFGRWDGSSYAGHNDLPPGFWVYVAPKWYIWGDVVEKPAIR